MESSDSASNKNEQVSNRTAINVGSRESQLALIQTNLVIEKLEKFYANNPDRLHQLTCPKSHKALNEISFNVVPMTTKGDQNLEKPLHALVMNKDSKSLFTKELEKALLDGQVDFIVHSLKDLPTTLPEGCVIGAVMARDSPDDTIVLKKSLRNKIDPLDLILGKNNDPTGAEIKVGTSSLRRIAMLKRYNPKLSCKDIRGNLNTRLSKLDRDDSEYTAIVLAKAGLDRMGWSDRTSALLSPTDDSELSDWCYAVGQGAIAVECRANDQNILNLLSPLAHAQTTFEVIAERCLMRKIGGGCSAPLGVRSTWKHGIEAKSLTLEGIFLSIDGKTKIKAIGHSSFSDDSSDISTSCSIELLTGIDISAIPNGRSGNTKQGALTCANLGISVANKMIDSDCLGLMSCRK